MAGMQLAPFTRRQALYPEHPTPSLGGVPVSVYGRRRTVPDTPSRTLPGLGSEGHGHGDGAVETDGCPWDGCADGVLCGSGGEYAVG
ncbi:hypothetical protein HYALB_00006369 [Hymenoscyphus albidus]|uniref:Uncharacterized protein n=1 Tax=Hymenoscyphus albidus TaxID=595503 RepID=A0A9N9PYV3_9HELO|nr:hypothetical protein HYALB_00006369 [Hymenoscyphus albidus]